MDNYEKYYKINEYIGTLKLSTEATNHYKDMFIRLDQIREQELTGNLSEEDKVEKTTIMADMDSFINNFVEGKRHQIELNIDEFKKHVEKVNRKFDEIKAKFVLEDELDLGTNEIIKALNDDFLELIAEAKALISEIDEFKKYVSGYTAVEFSLNYKEINKSLTTLKEKAKELKQHQIDKYNARVESVNKMLEELKATDGLSSEILDRINSLTSLSVCDFSVRSWNELKYMNTLDYDSLIKLSISIMEIQKEIKDVKIRTATIIDLDSSIEWIEKRLNEIDNQIGSAKTFGDLKDLDRELAIVVARITEFEVKLNNSKKMLTEEQFKQYEDRLNDAQIYAAEINEKIKNHTFENNVPVPSEYELFANKLKSLYGEVISFSNLIESLHGRVLESAVDVLNMRVVNFEAGLEIIEKEIENKYKDGKLDENQYNELKKQVEEIKNILEKTRTKLKEPEMFKDVDIFAFLNGEIDGLEKSIDELEKTVDSLEKPIKDRATRKKIDLIIKRLEKDIKNIETQLEMYKDKNPEKYETAKVRLDNTKKKLNDVCKKYRVKCPLLVRAVKSAKKFFKKHKKIMLIIAGLAAFALLSHHVIIPAIMHGNMMIGYSMPALNGFASFSTNVLGGMIGAHQSSTGAWYLANGIMINPTIVSTSLLKGLAISGIGQAALIAPVVVAIKKLTTKMNLPENMKKFGEAVKRTPGKIKDSTVGLVNKGVSAVKGAPSKIKNSTVGLVNKGAAVVKNKKSGSDRLKKMKFLDKLLTKYESMMSELSFEEFCEKVNLSSEDKVALEKYAEYKGVDISSRGRSR